MIPRPIINVVEFEYALERAGLEKSELEIINYIRYMGTFTQPLLVMALKLESKPPALSKLCLSCRKIGLHIPNHFKEVREWSKTINEDGIRWDGNLICSIAQNIDGEKLIPENNTSQFHCFAVHKELFIGF